MADPIIGLDIGTAYSYLTMLNGRNIVSLVPSEYAQAGIDSLSCYNPSEDNLLHGTMAKSYAVGHPECALINAKMYLPNNTLTASYTDHGAARSKSFPASQLITEQVKGLMEQVAPIIESYVRAGTTKTVVAYPISFTETQRFALIRCLIDAGLEVVGSLSEPQAAALAYCNEKKRTNARVLIADLGAGTFDLCLLDCTRSREGFNATINYTPLSQAGCQIGGRDFDDVLFNHMVKRMMNRGIAFTSGLRSELRQQCIAAKHAFSQNDSFFIQLAQEEVTAGTFNELSQPLLERLGKTLRPIAQEAHRQNCKDCILVGGGAEMPLYVNFVRDFIRENLGRGWNVEAFEPHTAVAKGCALYGGSLGGASSTPGRTVRNVQTTATADYAFLVYAGSDITLNNATVHNVYVLDKIIKAGSTLPASSGWLSYVTPDETNCVAFSLYELEKYATPDDARYAEQKLGKFIGKVELPFAKTVPAMTPIEGQVTLDAATNLITVSVRDQSGKVYQGSFERNL